MCWWPSTPTRISTRTPAASRPPRSWIGCCAARFARPPRIAQPPLLLAPQATGTADLPLRAVHERAAEMEAEEAVVCICVMGGFAYADLPFTGASIIVTTRRRPRAGAALRRRAVSS